MTYAERPRRPGPPDSFKEFEASELFCPRCRQAMPVRRRLLLVLPDGDLYEYRCAKCAERVGSKREKNSDKMPLKIIRG